MRLKHSEILSDLIEAYEAWGENDPEPSIVVGDQAIRITVATGKLWHCRELMPNRLRRAVLEHIVYGETSKTETTLSTYGQGRVSCADEFERQPRAKHLVTTFR